MSSDDTSFYCGDMATMVTMAKYATKVIKAIDPNALILSLGVTVALALPASFVSFSEAPPLC